LYSTLAAVIEQAPLATFVLVVQLTV